ncbi:amyloid-beta A4 precursor protein-binding family A member 3 [Periophthalmus magnuspinnatus]|uniref:amyloid-beta A4 precursor protein-binding family A member 3 n=1 Tax=Periophthalmus magnuspinnatus TaxID=409849 RepID=UPI00145A0CA4|nr:amyloid-beta A4 precursor protein-binding family A member 3 [Periophthalmus magnuspinnatus]
MDTPPPDSALMATSSGDSRDQTSSPLPPLSPAHHLAPVHPLQQADVEELDSFDPLEPPPLDWRSDSSSEGGSADGLNDLTDSLDKAMLDSPVTNNVGLQESENIQKKKVFHNLVPVYADDLNQELVSGVDAKDDKDKASHLKNISGIQEHNSNLEEHGCIHFLGNQPTSNQINQFSRVVNMESVFQVSKDKFDEEFGGLNQEFNPEIPQIKVYKILQTELEGSCADVEPQDDNCSNYESDPGLGATNLVEMRNCKTAKPFQSEFEGIHTPTDFKPVEEPMNDSHQVSSSNQDYTERTSCGDIEDEDHSRIHSLLNKLQLRREGEEEGGMETYLAQRSPPRAVLSQAQPTCPEADETTGLLFSEDHQRDVVSLLQSTDIPGPVPHTGDMDAVVSVSYSQEDTRRYWGHYDKAPAKTLRQDSFSSQPDEEEPEPVWMKLGEEPPDDQVASGTDMDAEPSYKDVPGPCDPEDLLDGVIFGAKYLGSTQIRSDRNPSTNARMSQAQEAVDRIKAPEGESQPMTEVDLFISTKRIKVLTADTQEAMMDHPLQMISYIADIGHIVVLMARRKRKGPEAESQKKCLMICHVFTSDDAQVIAQAIGQAFGVAYQQFLQVNGIRARDLKPGEYSHYLESQELYNGDLAHFCDAQNLKEVVITKPPGEMLGLAVVESGWGSILPTVVVANMLHGGPVERCGELSIGDRIMSVNGTSLVGLPISTCQNIIRDLKSQKYVKLSIVHCPPVTMAIIRRPTPKYQLGFSVEDGIICSLMRGGIAERGGIRVGHRIIEINGQSVVATTHDKIIQTLTNAVGEIHLKTMPASTYRLLTGQEQPVYL